MGQAGGAAAVTSPWSAGEPCRQGFSFQVGFLEQWGPEQSGGCGCGPESPEGCLPPAAALQSQVEALSSLLRTGPSPSPEGRGCREQHS